MISYSPSASLVVTETEFDGRGTSPTVVTSLSCRKASKASPSYRERMPERASALRGETPAARQNFVCTCFLRFLRFPRTYNGAWAFVGRTARARSPLSGLPSRFSRAWILPPLGASCNPHRGFTASACQARAQFQALRVSSSIDLDQKSWTCRPVALIVTEGE